MHGVIAPSINIIFSVNDHKTYTDKALLYQDILLFSINRSVNSFGIWDLSKYLLGRNKEFISYYTGDSKSHTTMSNRIENVQKRIKRNIDNLLALGLIKNVGIKKHTKGTGTVTIYDYTPYAIILASLVQTANSIQRDEGIKRIYDTLMSIYTINQDSPVAQIFYHKFFKNCNRARIFSKLIDHIFLLANSQVKYNTINDLFISAMDLGFEKSNDRKKFLSVWMRTIDKLTSKNKAILLFQMKLNAENRYRSKLQYYSREYEEKWFEFKHDYERIVIEATCHKCNQEVVLVYPYIAYRKEYAKVEFGRPILVDCLMCKKRACLEIPSF